jgi:L-seryl-tRNA(Ser) seleniumtransferase
MVYVFTGPRSEVQSPSFADIGRIAKAKEVPVVVDAAAEFHTIPNYHLQQGATMVCYSGGKCIRGPQCAGLLPGRKDLVKAAWITAPRTMASPTA